MRLSLISALTVCGLVLGTTHAAAQGPVKPVEVVNLPAVQDVFVTNDH